MSDSMMFDGKKVLNDLTGVLVAHVNGNQPITGNHIEKAIQAISTLIGQKDALIADAKLSALPPGKVLCDAEPIGRQEAEHAARCLADLGVQSDSIGAGIVALDKRWNETHKVAAAEIARLRGIIEHHYSSLPHGKVLCDAKPRRFICPDTGDTCVSRRAGWTPLYAAAKGG